MKKIQTLQQLLAEAKEAQKHHEEMIKQLKKDIALLQEDRNRLALAVKYGPHSKWAYMPE